MPTQWTDQQRKVAEVILKHRKQEHPGYEYNPVQAELPNISPGTISKVAKALRAINWSVPPKGEERGTKEKEGGKLATITAKQPAPVVFTVGKREIEMEAGDLLEAHMLYEDMKARCDLKDGFSSVILDGVGLLWRVLVGEPRIEDGKVKMEVTNGRSNG